jgi:H+/Cl- antiporter ClcA
MRKKILESSILFVSIIKWLFLAVCVGILVGVSTAVFLKSLDVGIAFAKRLHYYYLLLPVALLLSTLMVRYLAPQAEGHGTEKVIEAVHRYSGRINPLVVPVKLIATIITISMGGSAGKEGPAAQIGAGLCSAFSAGSLLGLDKSLFAAIGMVSLLAGAANTPISASIMAVELFGPQIGPYAAVACIISFLMTGHRSVYPSQVLSMQKSASLAVEKGREMRDIEDVEFQPRPKSISAGISRLKRFKRK